MGLRRRRLRRAVIGRPSWICGRRLGWLGRRRRLVGGLYSGMSLLSGRFAFFERGWIVLGQQFEVDAIRGADGLQLLSGSASGLGVFTDDAGKEETFGVLEITDQFDGAVARAYDVEMEGNAAVLFADRLDGGDHYASGQDGFKVLHGERPGEGFFVEEFVEGLGLEQQAGVGRLAHEVLVSLPFLGDAGDLAVEGMIAGASGFSLTVKQVQSQTQEESEDGEHAHADAQTLVGWSQISKGARGEIESNAHGVNLPPPVRRPHRQC